MDLSSHNVMVSRDLLIKLIDFGEAYHPYIDTDKTLSTFVFTQSTTQDIRCLIARPKPSTASRNSPPKAILFPWA